QAMFRSPSPSSIPPKAPPASVWRTPCARTTTTTASTGPMNPSHATGDAVRASSDSIGGREGSTPTAAAMPATRPTAPNRATRSGASTLTSRRPSASIATAINGGRSLTANDRVPATTACMAPSTSRTRSAMSSVGTAAMAALPARPAPPRRSSARRDAAGGAKATANASAAAAMTNSSAASGGNRASHRQPTQESRHQAAYDVRPHSRFGRPDRANRRRAQGDDRNRAQLRRRLSRRQDTRGGERDSGDETETQRCDGSGGHRVGDPERDQRRRYAEDQARCRSGREDLPAARTDEGSASRSYRPARRDGCGGDCAGGDEREHGQAQQGQRDPRGQPAPAVSDHDQRRAEPHQYSGGRVH